MKKYTEIDGWFDYLQVYQFLVDQCEYNDIFVECGAWLGKSSSYLCEIAQDKLQLYIVDSWKGSTNELDSTHKLAKITNVYDIFINNLSGYKYNHFVGLSENISKNFDDESCKVVFIDMEHTYEAVKADISYWLPKVKIGGYIAGHDYVKGWDGVIKAVDETFSKNNINIMQNCWIYKKENENV